jgi:hypothetical protein
MNRHYRSRHLPDHVNEKNVRIRYRRHTMFLICIERFGRVGVGNAEIALCHFARPVRCRMHGNACMPQKQRQQDGKTDVMCGESHTISDQHSRELFRPD